MTFSACMRSKLSYFKPCLFSPFAPSLVGLRYASLLQKYYTTKFTPQLCRKLLDFSASGPLLNKLRLTSGLVFNNVKTKVLNSTAKIHVLWALLRRNISHYIPCRVARVPYSGKYHVIFAVPEFLESRVMEMYPESNTVEDYHKLVLPPSHPQTRRVTRIAKKIAQAMHNGLGLKMDCSVRACVPRINNPPKLGSRQVVGASRDIRKLREKKIMNFGRRFSTKHLEGLEWRIVVVDSPDTDIAEIDSDGTMFIYSGLLDCSSDEILAFTIGHEFGHVIAQHFDLTIFRQSIIALLMWPVYKTSKHVQWQKFREAMEIIDCFFSRRDELEADHIGMMLTASAGYDPTEAPKHYRECRDSPESELDETDEFTHPRNSTRAMSLENPKKMNKAIAVYREVRKAGVRNRRK